MKCLLKLIFLVLTAISASLFAEQEPVIETSVSSRAGTENQVTALTGTHGMVVFNNGDGWYASHMPLANSIHSHQILFRLSFNKPSKSQKEILEKHLDRGDLLTLVPRVFDLMRLKQQSLDQILVDVYSGHFERGGQLVIESITVNIEELLLNQMLAEGNNGNYFVIKTSQNSGLLVHKIASSPSFDQIIGFKTAEPQESNRSTPERLNFYNSLPLVSTNLHRNTVIIGRQYYLETKDFSR